MSGTDALTFQGSQAEYEELLEKEVANGNLTQEVADAMLSAFVQTRSDVSELERYLDDPDNFVPTEKEDAPFVPLGFATEPLQSIVPAQAPVVPEREPSFLEKVQAQELAAMNEAARNGTLMPSHEVIRNRAAIGRDYAVQGLTDEELVAEGSPEALEELAQRKKHADQTFIESLSNPYSYARLFGSIGRAPIQIGNLPQNLYGLGKLGIENVTGADLGAQETLLDAARKQREAERSFGTTPAITPGESFVESLTGALVPGGLIAKGTGVGVDFMADQTIRELTDDVGEKYETVFDHVGITDNTEKPVIGTMAAIGVTVLAGTVSAAAINRMTTTKIETPTIRPLKEIDPTAPDNLSTVEKASDLTKTNIVDEQQALRDIIRRNGIPNADEIDARIEFDTHAAARTRVAEAINTGQLTTRDAVFKSPIAPKDLYDAYNALSGNVRQQVGRYINLKDMRDDIQIAIEKGEATPDALLAVDEQIALIAKQVPEAEEFSKRYNTVTSSLREFAQGSLFSEKYKLQLDKTRNNYVPLEISDVDPTAPFLQRLKQAQSSDVGRADPEWFLQNRAIGSYDMERRADPMVMLMQSVEATLTARMKNDTKVAIIDSLLSSETGSQTMRLATSEEVGKHADRLVQIYRNGERETYITSKLTANLLKFDPYIAKHPELFVPKRIFEQAAVGPVSLTFAPVTALRDTIGGRVTRPDGLKAPNPIDVAAAIPQQLWAKSQGGISNFFQQSIVKGETALPSWLMSPEQQKHFADNIANSYTRTLYHQANNAGGFDASLMKNKIELGQGALAEIKRSLTDATVNVNVPGARFSANRIRNMIDGFNNIFNAIQDAPRFAAIQKTVKDGTSIEDATALARQLTGDVTKSGRVYDATGKQIQVDAVDQGLLNVANKGIGKTTEFLRESTPFLNPMIQGNRRLLQSIVDDPIGFNARAWTNIGLPTLAVFGWNEMLGKEYNDYAMQQRSARDVVMNLYIGIPGKPPEEGIEIPMMHELLTYSAPYNRGLYAMSRGEDSEKTRAALSIVAENIFNNSLDVGFPVAGQVGANIVGFSAPDSLARPTDGVFQIREDDLGVLPQNMEHLARTLFAGIGDTTVHVANAVAGDPSFETFYTEMRDRTLARTPIVKNAAGLKRSNVHFSIPNQVAQERFDAVADFRRYYNAFYEPKRFNDDGLQKPSSRNGFTRFKDAPNPLTQEDLPFLMQGPEQLQQPVNPLFQEFGPLIVDDAFRGTEGMTALTNRADIYAKFTKRLRQFNAGDREALQEWQAMLSGIIPQKEGTQQLKDLVADNDIDLTQYDDRVKLINLIEGRRSEIIRGQIDVFDRLEDKITAILRERGVIGEDEEFDVTKHLNPHDPNPLGIGAAN